MFPNSQCQRSRSASDIGGCYQHRYERALDEACERNDCFQSQANGDYCKSKYERALNDACGLACDHCSVPQNYGYVTTNNNNCCNTACTINAYPNRNCSGCCCPEEKFSNMVPPAFLAKDFVPYRIKKRKSCSDFTVQRPPLTTVKCCISPEWAERFCSVCRIEPAPPCNIQSCPRRNPPSFLVLPMTASAVAPSGNATTLPQPASKANSKAHSTIRRTSPANPINSKISSRRASPARMNGNKLPITSSPHGEPATKSNTDTQNQPTPLPLQIDLEPIAITAGRPAPQPANGLQSMPPFESRQPVETGYPPVRSKMASKSSTAQSSNEKLKIVEAGYSVQSKKTSKPSSSVETSSETIKTVDDANKELKEKVLAAYDNYNKCMEETGYCSYKPIEFCSCLKVKSDKRKQKEQKEQKEQNGVCCPTYATYHQTNCCVVPKLCPVYDPEELNEDDVFDTNVDINTDYDIKQKKNKQNKDEQNKDEQNNKDETNSEVNTASTSKASCHCEGENAEACICAPTKPEDKAQDEQQKQAKNEQQVPVPQCLPNCNRCCPWYMYGCYPIQPPQCNMYSYYRGGACCHHCNKCCCWRCRNICYTTLTQLQQRQDQQRASAEYYTKMQQNKNGYEQMDRNYEQYNNDKKQKQSQPQPRSVQSAQSNGKMTTPENNTHGRSVAGSTNSPIYAGNRMGLPPFEYGGAPFMRWQKFFSCPAGGYIMYGNQCTINPYYN